MVVFEGFLVSDHMTLDLPACLLPARSATSDTDPHGNEEVPKGWADLMMF